MIAFAKFRALTRIELDLQKAVEAVVDVVLRLGGATVTTKLKNKLLRKNIFGPQGNSMYRHETE